MRTASHIHRGVNVTDFILDSACTRAEEVIADQTLFAVSPRQWKKFIAALDRVSAQAAAQEAV